MDHMLHDVSVRNYRGFSDFTLAGLKRVNLFVGKNNSGKTSLLEAIQILAAGDLWTLLDIAERRGEVLVEVTNRERRLDETMEVAHFFHGHDVGLGSTFEIRSRSFDAALRFLLASPVDVDPQLRLFEEDDASVILQLDRQIRENTSTVYLPLTQLGTARRRQSQYRERGPLLSNPPRIKFITPDSLSSRSLTEMWQQVMVEGAEEPIVEALQLIEPTIKDVRFLPEQSYRRDRHGIVIGLKNHRGRVPLGSMGDGIRRLLALATSLSSASDGFLFIDEIDTGLHYSILSDLWQLVVGTAIRNSIQVFATTHSLDCLRSLASACELDPNLADEVAVNSIAQDSLTSVALSAEELQAAVEHNLEVRG
jgi:ABC-type transport system involved in cytochrome c biogenesis ATPase subunit